MTSPSRQTFTFATDDQLTPTFGRQTAAGQVLTKRLDKVGDAARETARDFTVAERSAAKLTDELGDMAREARKTEQALRAAGQQRDALGRFTKGGGAGPTLPGVPSLPGGGGGGGGASLLGGLFSKAVGSPLMAAGIAGAIVASPLIGAALNSALLAGIGGGALGAGIASAIVHDEALKTAFKGLGRDFKDIFADLGEPFVGPLHDAVQIFRNELAGVSGQWTKAIGGMADVVEPLARGVAGLFRQATPGFVKAFEAAKPMLLTLATELPNIGNALSDMFDSLADAAPEAKEGFRDLLKAAQGLIVIFGQTIEVLSNTYYWTKRIGEAVTRFIPQAEWLYEHIGPPDEQIAKIKGAGHSMTEFATAADKAEVEVAGLNRAMTELLDRFLSLDELEIRVAEGFDRVAESIKENGRTLDINTEAGRNNARTLLDQVEALKDQRQANIDGGMSVIRANELYNKQYDALVKLASQMGISKKALLELLGPYNQFQSKTVTLEIRQVFTQAGAAYSIPGRPVKFMAGGGDVYRGVPVVVGDAGRPEVFVPNSDGTIHPDARRFATSGGGGPVVIELHQTIVSPDGRSIANSIERYAVASGQRKVSQVLGLQAA